MENSKTTAKFIVAFFIGFLVEVVILLLYFGIYGRMDDEGWTYFFIVAVSIIAFIAASKISDNSPNVEISKGFGIAQGCAMLFPVVWVGNLSDYTVVFTILFVIAFIFFVCGTIDIFKKNEWNGSLWKLTLSFALQSLYAFAFATIGGFVLALIYVLTGGDRRRRKRKKR